jgi:hypothetical protein
MFFLFLSFSPRSESSHFLHSHPFKIKIKIVLFSSYSIYRGRGQYVEMILFLLFKLNLIVFCAALLGRGKLRKDGLAEVCCCFREVVELSLLLLEEEDLSFRLTGNTCPADWTPETNQPSLSLPSSVAVRIDNRQKTQILNEEKTKDAHERIVYKAFFSFGQSVGQSTLGRSSA